MSDFFVYTAITRGYDSLNRAPSDWKTEANFVAFLDSPAMTDWQIMPICREFRDPCRNAKIHKILAHEYFPEAQYSLWVDGSVQIIAEIPLIPWAEQCLGLCDLAVFRHRCRNCVYVEANHCISCQVDSPQIINAQMEKYRLEGYPENNGLAECTVLLRRHTPAMRRFNEAWYREICAHSRRDQLSFNYVVRKLDFPYAQFPGNMAANPYFRWLPHAATASRLLPEAYDSD